MGKYFAEGLPEPDEWLVFVSYSHDDTWLLPKLGVHLSPLLPDGVALWDDTKIRVGDEWDERIDLAIERSLLAVLVVSPEFVASPYITETEVPRIQQRAVPLGAILARTAPWEQLPFLSDEQWAHDDVGREGPISINAQGLEASGPELDAALQPLCKRIAARVQDELAVRGGPAAGEPGPAPTGRHSERAALVAGEAGEPVGCPELPRDYVPRAGDLDRLRRLLLGPDPALGLAGEVADVGLQGQGGIGKTVLATALARDDEVRRHFPDGVYWVTLGKDADIVAKQVALLALVGAGADVRSTVDAKQRLVERFADMRALIVVDDVWSGRAASAFDVNGPKGRVLYTTRDHRVLEHVGAEVGRVDVLDAQAADTLLARTSRWAGDVLPPAAAGVFAATGSVALAVALVGASLRGRPEAAWAEAVADLAISGETWGGHPYANTFKAMDLAVAALDEPSRDLLTALAVFPEDVEIPVVTVARLWNRLGDLDGRSADRLLEACAERDLLTLESGRVSLHDLQRDFFALRADDLSLLHGELVDAHRPEQPARWSGLPADEPYMWDHLLEHLDAATEFDELTEVASDPAWLLHRLRGGGRVAATADLARALRADHGNAALAWLLDGVRAFGHLVLGAADPTEAAATLRARVPPSVGIDVGGLALLLPDPALNPRWDPCDTDERQLMLLDGHAGFVNSVAFNHDGTRLATASHDGTARIWNPTTGEQLTQLDGHTGPVTSVAFNHDGTRLATASEDNSARVWDPTTGDQLTQLDGHTNSVTSVAFNHDGTRLATANQDGTARLWNPTTGDQLTQLDGHAGAVWSVAFNHDGTRLATANQDGTARLWNPTTGDQLTQLDGHAGAVWSVAFNHDGTRLATASEDSTARVWDPATGDQLTRLDGHTDLATSAAFNHDGTRLATASLDRAARIWNPTTGEQLTQLDRHDRALTSVAFNHDGTRLATASWDATARIWNPTTGEQLMQLDGHTGPVTSVAFNHDGTRLATASHDGTARIWNPTTGEQLIQLGANTDSMSPVAFNHDGTRLATASHDGTARIWNPTTGHQLTQLDAHGPVTSVAFNLDGTRLATAGADGTARIWDPTTGHLLTTVRVGQYATAVAWAGTALAVAYDKTFMVYDLVAPE